MILSADQQGEIAKAREEFDRVLDKYGERPVNAPRRSFWDHFNCACALRPAARLAYAPLPQKTRHCTPQETFQLSWFLFIAKGCVTMLTFTAVLVYLQLERELPHASLFDCNASSPLSIIQVDELQDVFDDDGVLFCYFKSAVVVAGGLVMIPFLMEEITTGILVLMSSVDSQVLVPLVDGNYVGDDPMLSAAFSFQPWIRILSFPVVIIAILQNVYKNSTGIETASIYARFLVIFLLLVLPEILLTVALLFVSYYVILSSGTPSEVLVNLVAVQVFSQLDDLFVKMVFRPRASVGENIGNYVKMNANSTKAQYSPVESFLLNKVRHQMGITPNNPNDMGYYYQYKGMSIV